MIWLNRQMQNKKLCLKHVLSTLKFLKRILLNFQVLRNAILLILKHSVYHNLMHNWQRKHLLNTWWIRKILFSSKQDNLIKRFLNMPLQLLLRKKSLKLLRQAHLILKQMRDLNKIKLLLHLLKFVMMSNRLIVLQLLVLKLDQFQSTNSLN